MTLNKRNHSTVSVTALVLMAALTLSCIAEAQVPQINQPLVPASIAPESSGLTLTVNGTGFTPSSIVNWNGSGRATKFISSTKLTAQITASDVDSPGTATVTVLNGGAASNVVCFETTNATTSVSFTKADYASGPEPESIVTGDFNGDGRLDLVLANYGNNTVSVLLGNGDGTFQGALTYPTNQAGTGYMVGVGDFNNDGKLDFAVANAGTAYGSYGTVSVFLGNGDGTFQPAASYLAGRNPAIGGVGDFNGDGKMDLVVANNAGGDVSVLLGNGDGGFQPPIDYPAGAAPSMVTVGDFNHDGKLDLAVVNTLGNSVSILLGNGDGTFQGALNYSVGSYPVRILAADFNRDGKLDLAVINQQNQDVSIMIGNGDGTFQQPLNYGTAGVGFGMAVADLNGDGNLDLVTANYYSKNLTVLLGNGDGTFQPAVNYAADTGSWDVAAGDFNGDGRMDMAVANYANLGSVSVFLQPTPAGGLAQLGGGNTFSGNQIINGTVSATAFVGNGSGLTNVTASGISCLGCIGNTQLGINYAGSATQGGPALNSVALGGFPASSFASIGSNAFVGDQTINGNLSATGAIKIGGGTAITEYISITQSLTLPGISPATCITTTTAAISGFTPGASDSVALGLPTGLVTGLGSGIFLTYQAWETSTASNPTITIQVCNPTAKNYKGGNSGSVRIDVFKH